jgi:hypothetical protein
MVRLSWHPDDQDIVYVACRFRSPLTPDDVRELGLGAAACTPEPGFLAVPSEKMPFQASIAGEATLEVLPGAEGGEARADDDPAFAGPLVAMNRSAIAFRLPARDASEVVARLSSRPFDVRVSSRGRTMWSGKAWLLAVRAGCNSPDLEVVVQAKDEPSDALRSLFRGRTKAFSG